MSKVAQTADPFEQMLESIIKYLLYGKGTFMVDEAADQLKLLISMFVRLTAEHQMALSTGSQSSKPSSPICRRQRRGWPP